MNNRLRMLSVERDSLLVEVNAAAAQLAGHWLLADDGPETGCLEGVRLISRGLLDVMRWNLFHLPTESNRQPISTRSF